ncbi:MAG: terpene utilization protein AtuA [Burkholderiales bacterium RIFCSPHIGHO2_12_FULL_69_20]|nr:MAG: terpene utilization protein AtuA [Burkholderiales bacterium RIFCSPHIGHO2_12_FULL_69_20]
MSNAAAIDHSRPPLRIGGASGFWGDSSLGAPQLVNSGLIDVLVFDYLAETTMAILASAQRKNPDAGYATDFVEAAMRQVLPQVVQRGIKVVSNAGGINPQACARALAKLADELGMQVRIAVVEGDDVREALPALRAAAPGGALTDLVGGQPVPDQLLSANAYLGAEPVARALAAGADVVITGRCVDSAVTLGPLIHHFGWTMDQFDALAGGSLAGHIIECGCQATGGLFTDWDQVPDWAHIGYPIVDVASDGSFTVGKVPGTGGLISPATVGEQLLYEIGDPGAYLLPDVACDFRQVRIEQVGEHRVRVSGARGSAPPPSLKVSATTLVGWRVDGMTVIVGIDAVAKARRTGESLIERTREMILARGWGDFSATRVEVIGTETLYGPRATTAQLREVIVRVAVRHPRKEALELFTREKAAPGTSWSPGTTGPGGGRGSVSPHIVPCAFLIPRGAVQPVFRLGEQTLAVSMADTARPLAAPATLPDPAPWTMPAGPTKTVPLIQLAWGRSGDKGDLSNIGLIARRPEWLPLLWAQVTPEVVKAWFAHLVKGRVDRFHLPGLHAMNLVMHQALEGGGPASLRLDPLGKGMAQMLLELPVQVPADWPVR